jgi:homoserine O-acetyltransferase
MSRIQVPVVSVGIWSDILYPSYQQRQIRDILESSGGTCDYIEIDSPHGHDAFLIEFDQVSAALHGLFSRLH